MTLHTRLKDHNRTIGSADNLTLCDFNCRYLVVRSAWVEKNHSILPFLKRPIEIHALRGARARDGEVMPLPVIHRADAGRAAGRAAPKHRHIQPPIRADVDRRDKAAVIPELTENGSAAGSAEPSVEAEARLRKHVIRQQDEFEPSNDAARPTFPATYFAVPCHAPCSVPVESCALFS